MFAHVFRVVLVPTLLLVTISLRAGDLDPPRAPSPTAGPEPRIALNQENTPGDGNSRFRITSAGSHYLTGNVLLGVAFNGIEIGSSNVTVDLNGFTLGRSQFLQSPPLSGIVADPGLENIIIRNGIVRSFTQSGIDLANVTGALVQDVIASDNGDTGIHVGDQGVVTDCVARDNGGAGIRVGRGGHASRCTVADNDSTGLQADFGGATINECTAVNNGMDGIKGSSGSVIARCTSQQNTGSGFEALASIVVECSAIENSGAGINLNTGSVALNNTCIANDVGIRVDGSGTRVEGNTLLSNNRGIEADTGSEGGALIVRNRATGSPQDHYGSIGSGHALGTIQTSPVGAGPWDNFAP